MTGDPPHSVSTIPVAVAGMYAGSLIAIWGYRTYPEPRTGWGDVSFYWGIIQDAAIITAGVIAIAIVLSVILAAYLDWRASHWRDIDLDHEQGDR